MNDILPVIEAHRFAPRDFVAGHPVLDFVNTVTGRNASPRDWLVDDQALAQWGETTDLICEAIPAAGGVRPKAGKAPSPTFAQAKSLREALHGVFKSIAEARPPAAGDVATLERHWKAAVQRGRLRAVGQKLVFASDATQDARALVDELAIRAVDLLREDISERLKVCAGPNCGWLFLDTSKAGRRRWCDMRTCGNDAKARSFRSRQR